MACGSGLGFNIHANKVPVLDGTRKLAEDGFIPGGSKSNHKWLSDNVQYADDVDEITQFILCDAVTSGGLLVALPQEQADQAVQKLQEAGVEYAARTGEVVNDHPNCISVSL
jgi:selenide,water dikinase